VNQRWLGGHAHQLEHDARPHRSGFKDLERMDSLPPSPCAPKEKPAVGCGANWTDLPEVIWAVSRTCAGLPDVVILVDQARESNPRRRGGRGRGGRGRARRAGAGFCECRRSSISPWCRCGHQLSGSDLTDAGFPATTTRVRSFSSCRVASRRDHEGRHGGDSTDQRGQRRREG